MMVVRSYVRGVIRSVLSVLVYHNLSVVSVILGNIYRGLVRVHVSLVLKLVIHAMVLVLLVLLVKVISTTYLLSHIHVLVPVPPPTPLSPSPPLTVITFAYLATPVVRGVQSIHKTVCYARTNHTICNR
jgi:hypothetical protein